MAHDGYRYFGGQPITAFPPLFSLFLIPFQIFGVSGLTLARVVVMLAGVTGILWTSLSLRLCNTESTTRNHYVKMLLAVFVGSGVGCWYDALLSETLFLPLLGWLYILLLEHNAQHLGWWRCGGIAAVMTACVLCRNVALAYVLPVGLVVAYSAKGRGYAIAACMSGIVIGIPCAAWGIMMTALQQAGSREVNGPGIWWDMLFVRLSESTQGFADLFGCSRFGIGMILASLVCIFLCVLSSVHAADFIRKIRIWLFVAMMSFAGTFAMMVLLPTDTMGGRFLWPTFIVLICAGLALSTWSKDHRLVDRGFLYVLSIVISLQVVRLVSYVVWDSGGVVAPPNIRHCDFIEPKSVVSGHCCEIVV